MVKVSIVGATGYTGGELIRLLVQHPEVELVYLTSRSYVGQKIQDIFPNLVGFIDQECVAMDLAKVVADSDLIFAALPHGLSVPIAEAAYKAGKVFIDLGADFRIKDLDTYEKWYVKHDNPDLIQEAVYGLPETHRDDIKNAKIIANPGCFPTSVQLGLFPIMSTGLIDTDHIIIDSKSGTTGAGRSGNVANLHAEIHGNFKAYKVGNHRHTPEIEQELSFLADQDVAVSFTPHLLPTDRGILSTMYLKGKDKLNEAEIRALYQKAYQDETFVNLLKEGQFPEIKSVRGSNFAQVGLTVDERTNTLVVVSVIDNLMKGAAGQAVQNMNIVYGFEEKLGLSQPGLQP